MYFDGDKTLTHNCLFNLIIGNRGCGKSYWAKKRSVKNFLKDKSQFIYLRRYETELDSVKDSIFNDIILNNEFPDHEIEYKNNAYYINDELMGYAMALSKAQTYKSLSYPRVSFIIFDEFLIDESAIARYLKNEVQKFLDFYETVARTRNVISFFLSNAISFVNPYTMYFDLRLPYGKDIVKKEDLILLQLVMDNGFIEMKKKTRFGRLIEGTAYGDYAIENKFLRDNNNFIEKKTGNCNYCFTFHYDGISYGVWVNYQLGKMYVSNDVDSYCKIVYALTLDDHTENTLLLKNINKSLYFKSFMEAYKSGKVYFENLKIKNTVYNIIKLCIS